MFNNQLFVKRINALQKYKFILKVMQNTLEKGSL